MNEPLTPQQQTPPPVIKKSSKKTHHQKLSERHLLKLPTPPPDPTTLNSENTILSVPQRNDEEQAEQKFNDDSTSGKFLENIVTEKDKEMLDYIESLKSGLYSRSLSTPHGSGPVAVTEEAFDHLEKLYRMMEQMLDLREQNVRLHRRIRDLEHLNNLDKINTNLTDEDYPDLEKDTIFAEAILDNILQDPKNKDISKLKSIRPSILRRHRSGSGTEKQLDNAIGGALLFENDLVKKDKQSKVSKWTKVKAAFRWEKATNVGDCKSQDSGIHVPVNYEIARYLRVPSNGDEMGHSPVDSGAGISTPGTISSTSSNEDFHRIAQHYGDEELRSSDDEENISQTKEYQSKSPKSHHRHHHHHSRTPWAKMKNIIHSKNSLKKKQHRLSAVSDDIQIGVEFCSDNEDVFEYDDTKSAPLSLSPSPNVYSTSSASPVCSDIPQEVIDRYQRALAEDSTSDSETKQSKWARVSRAFLNHHHHHHYHPHHYQHYRSPKTSQSSQKFEDINVDEEIQRNYRNLQQKISMEFQDKLNEWDRLKQNSPGAQSSSLSPASGGFSSLEDNRDPAFAKKMEEWHKMKNQTKQVPLINYDVPPDFKKKLDEWEKIKKSNGSGRPLRKKLGEVTKWKSLGGPSRPNDQSPVFEYPPISEEFRKKLEEWKQIKASGGPSAYVDQKKSKEKTPSPKLSRKNSSPKSSKKSKDQNKELHWFEKEISKIEKEKQRLERERQKFIEREERLSKLRKTIFGSDLKKDVLIHTPSGFHRFEGISRKFTQKLYEWEKSQGIAPEESTFALLSSSHYVPEIVINNNSKNSNSCFYQNTSLPRSKSADSIAISPPNLINSLQHSTHPSSLSLNDMENLEKECMKATNSKSSSINYCDDKRRRRHYYDYHQIETNSYDQDEPEAVLVEVEDYEEETAEPLHVHCIERHQQLPVYQREEFKQLCESETIVVPKIRRSESARAQTNYDAMEIVGKILDEIKRNEEEIRYSILSNSCNEENQQNKFKFLNETQQLHLKSLVENLTNLQEANNTVINAIKDEFTDNINNNLQETLNTVQDLSLYMLQLAYQAENLIEQRISKGDSISNFLFDTIEELCNKIAELRRHLSYICAATDLTVPSSKASSNPCQNIDKERKFIKSTENAASCVSTAASQGAVKKRILQKQQLVSQQTVDDDGATKLRPTKKLTKTYSISDGDLRPPMENISSATDMDSSTKSDSKLDHSPSESAVTLFVKTTRKLFAPFVENILAKSASEITNSKINDVNDNTSKLDSLPPLPQSPIPQRKVYKEVSPSIRLIMAKYDQNVQQAKSAGSSGSNSPVAWRSPVTGRRLKNQLEKYQEVVNKSSPILNEKKIVQKSSSATNIKQTPDTIRKSLTLDNTNLSKKDINEIKKNLTLDIPLASNSSNDIRKQKIQKAKEEFLNTPPASAPSFASNDSLEFKQRNRFSQGSVESDSNCSCHNKALLGMLVKSASAGMINVDPDAYQRINPECHADGYVSLPRQTTAKTKDGFLSGKLAFSAIAAKFRKTRMRRTKEQNKNPNKKQQVAVMTLCRQSLLVDITPPNEACGGGVIGNKSNQENNNNNGEIPRCSRRNSKEEENRSTSPSVTSSTISKSSSWIRRNLFKK